MKDQRRRRGRPRGSIKETPRKRALVRKAAIDDETNAICERLIAGDALIVPIDLPRMVTIDDVGRALDDLVAAIAKGKLAPREGVRISKIIELRRKAFISIDLNRKLDQLQQKKADGERKPDLQGG